MTRLCHPSLNATSGVNLGLPGRHFKKPDTLDLLPSSVREPKIEGLDLYTYYVYIYIYMRPVRAEIFNWTSRPETRHSGSKPDTWQP